ncbi:MAG TPA: transposase [Pirellulales bacterium]|jgi:REP element-mobilizing transposase RayT|nr:transposase [Pirellulales bacterium]
MGSTLAIHWTVTTHGTWLHGDPKGSWKNGTLMGPDPLLRQAASENMTNEAETLSQPEIELAAEAFGRVCQKGGHQVLAATIRPIHAHLVLGRIASPAEKVIWWLKRQSAAAVFDSRRSQGRPTPRHLWTNRRFVVFIYDERHLANTIKYVQRHNIEAGLSANPYSWIDPLNRNDT